MPFSSGPRRRVPVYLVIEELIMANWYYARDNKQKLGPFSPARLKELADAGQLQPSDMVIREGGRKWVAAASIKGLFAKAAPGDHPAPSETSPPSPAQDAPLIGPDSGAAEGPLRRGEQRSGWVAKAAAFLCLIVAGLAVGRLLLQEAEFNRRLAESDGKVQEGAKEVEALRQRLTESEGEVRQKASKAASLEARLAKSEETVRKADKEKDALREDLARSVRQVGEGAAAVAALKRRVRLLALPTASSYALDQYALGAPREAEGSVESLAKYLAEPAENDREKVRAIFRWMTDRIAYDAKRFLKKQPGGDSPEEVLKKRRCVCGGYANLFEALCKQARVEAKVIIGDAKGYGYAPGKGPVVKHAWNAVELDGRWHLVDVTWASGYPDLDKGEFAKRLNEFYFLTPPDEFIFTHFPDNPKWQLLKDEVTRDDFDRFNKAGRDVSMFRGMSEEFKAKLRDGSFRGFVTVYSHPGVTVLIRKAPLEKHLRDGARHLFRVESAGFAAMAVRGAGDKITRLTRKGNVFEGEVSVGKGALQVAGQIPPKGELYWAVLEYVVE
jgi:hypothetical protein